jgi:hypothetical protein
MRATIARPCAEEPCLCGHCYVGHSMVGDWLRRRLRRIRARIRTVSFGRPGRYGPDGELLVPVWVYEVFERVD